MVWPALALGAASIASNVIGGIAGAKHSKKQLKKWKYKSLEEAARDEEEQRQALLQQEREAKKTYADIFGGYERARGSLASGASAARTAAYQQGQRLAGQVQSSMVGRGWSGSSAQTAGLRGAAALTARAVGDVEQQQAGALADLEIDQGRGLAAARSNLSNFYQRRAQIQSVLSDNRQNFLNTYYGMKMEGVGFSNPAGIIGNALNSYVGGGAFNQGGVFEGMFG